jgi:CBS domain-containing protein
MNKPIASVMASTVWTAGTEDTAEKVEALLNRRSLSAVPVVDETGRIFGIISAADIVRLHASKKNPRAVRAWELCTYKPLVADIKATTGDVARMMVEHRIHHVPVVEDGKLRGIVSALDFVRQYVLRAGP